MFYEDLTKFPVMMNIDVQNPKQNILKDRNIILILILCRIERLWAVDCSRIHVVDAGKRSDEKMKNIDIGDAGWHEL